MTLVSIFCRLPSVLLLLLVTLGSRPAHGTESAPSADETAALVALAAHAKQASPSYSDNDEVLLRLQDYANNIGKRAYSYVSEFKRLPVYNFGLGKRSSPQSQLYGFGLGKRAGGRTYSFGLGKRADDYDEEYIPYEENYEGEDSEDDTREEDEMIEKRNRLYSFGLGKRAKPHYSFGLGKRYPGDAQSMYPYDSSKRAGPQMYSFGLGKRADQRLYSFGLGKRQNKQSSRFGFGLGKRDSEEYEEEEKRAGSDHRYSFGLGKREISQKDVDDEPTTEAATQGHGRVKRSLQYGFGLGKRAGYNTDDRLQATENENDMARYARRQYGFGLGKRIPMYDFGIGKRSED